MKDIVNRALSYLRLQTTSRRIRRSRDKSETEPAFGPSSLNLLMVDKCNAGCIMCGHDYKSCGTSAALTLEKIKKIYAKLNMKQVVEVIYGGGGEPFLNPELPAIAAFTRQVNPAVQHTVISNMVGRCKAEVLDVMIENRVHFLVSVNAATKETFTKVAGVDAFDIVCENLRNIVATRRAKGGSSGISISMILMRQNIEELPEFIRLAKQLGVDGVKTLFVRIYPEKYRTKMDGSILIQPEDSLFHHQELCNRKIAEATKLAKELGVSFEHEPCFGEEAQPRERDCLEPWKSLFIGFNGELYPCAASEILFMHKVADDQYHTGNILTESLDDIWNNPFWQALRKTNCCTGRSEDIKECLCCGSSMNWDGVDERDAHIMDWTVAEQSELKI